MLSLVSLEAHLVFEYHPVGVPIAEYFLGVASRNLLKLRVKQFRKGHTRILYEIEGHDFQEMADLMVSVLHFRTHDFPP